MSQAPAPTFRRRRSVQLVLTLAFLGALLLPNVDLAYGLDPNPSPVKDPALFPTWRDARQPWRLPGQLFVYFKESMGFRGALVRAHGLLARSLLGVSPAPESVVLAEPWLFFKGERTLDDYRHVEPLTDAAIAAWRTVFAARRDWLAQRGIRYLLVITPNKETIYAQAVPAWINRSSNPSRLQQLSAALGATTNPSYLDLSQVLAADDGAVRLYHFTDTHWNDRGAFVGYQALAERLRAWFPELVPLRAETLAWDEVRVPGGDLARVCGLRGDLYEPEIHARYLAPHKRATFQDGSELSFERMDVRGSFEFTSSSPEGEIGSALILRDSFGELLIPYLAPHFRTATWIWTYDFPSAAILAQRPAVVIQQIVERRLMTIVPENPPEVAAVATRSN